MTVVRAQAPFFWPLRGSLALQVGSGSVTYTRATAAWEFNETGKLYRVPSGAVRMRGYRPVINQYSGNTDNMSGLSSARITLIDSATSDADGTTKAGTWRLDASAGEHYLRTQSGSYEGKYINIAYKIKLTSYRYIALRICGWYNFYDLQTQSWNGTLQGSSRDAVVSGDWVLLEMTGGPIPSVSPVFSLLFTSAAWGSSWTPLGTEEAIVYQAMMSDVTGDTDRTFSDYVAGNTSYGAGANGVKYCATYKDGTPIPEANLLGARLNPTATTNNLLHCRDLTNAAWVKTNVNPTLNQTGIDGQSNACSLVEFTADGGTVLQTITAAAAAGCSGYYVKRHTGFGTVEFTRDNVNWLDITSNLTESGFYFAKIENTSVTNPVIGFRGQNGNKIIVDAGINHLGAQICETPILTTTAAVTVNADVLTAPTASNFSDTAGTILATVTRDDWTAGNGSAVGSFTRGLYTSSANSGAQGLDGTNTVNGPSGTPSGTKIIGMRWSGSSLQAFSDGDFGAAGSYDGAFGLSTIGIMPGTSGYIKDVAIWPSSLSDADMVSAMDLYWQMGSFDALSKVANQNPPKLIWATKFAGVTLDSPVKAARDWNSAISGTDTLTGHGFTVDSDLQAFFGPTAKFRLQQINSSSQPIPTDLTAFNANFTNSISTSTDLISTPGAGHLSLRNLICTSDYPSQSILMCERSAPSSVNYDQTEFYYTGVYQFPVGMNLNASGKYKVFFEVKGGALKQSLVDAVVNGSVRDGSSCAASDGVANAGKFRIALMINGFFGTNAIQVKLDDAANNGGLTIPNAYYDATGYHESGSNPYTFFSTDSTSVLPSGVPLGVPLRFHVHYKRPPTPLYADRHKGIFKVAVENLATSEWFDLCSIQNSSAYQLSSTFNEPWSRIFPTSYDSTNDVELKMTDLQFWDKPKIDF